MVGQQVLHRVRIERSEDVERIEWIDPPRFPDFRAEWLPGAPEQRGTAPDGSTQWIREEIRALFPLRAGTLLVSESRISCRSRSGEDGPLREQALHLSGQSLTAVRAPQAGRPEDYFGLVGRPHIQLAPLPAHVELGETLRVSISMRGAVNLWDEPSPLDEAALARDDVLVEIFPSEQSLDLERGTRLQVRRFDRVEVVPRETGTLSIRTREIVWYDPEQRRYERSAPQTATVEVVPAGAAAP